MASKLPDFKEITQIAGKLFTDMKKSVTEICQDYKNKRAASDENPSPSEKPEDKKEDDKK